MYLINSAAIDVTYKCNLRCKHCYNCSGESNKAELTFDELVDIGKQLGQLSLQSICICGGEPLMRADDVIGFITLLNEASPSSTISMVSNGLLWTQDIAEKLAEAGLDGVQFSLDGLSDEAYDFVRQSSGQLYKVKQAIDYALKAGLNVIASALPHKKSLSEFPLIIDYCASKGLSELRIQPLMPLGRGENNYDALCLSPEDQHSLAALLKEKNPLYQDLEITWGDPIDHYFMFEEVGYIPNITINAQGQIIACPYLPFSIWNLRNRTLDEYLELKIPSKALRHPAIKSCVEGIASVEDMTSKREGLPYLNLDEALDLSQEIINL